MVLAPLWLDSTTFGFWSSRNKQEDSVFYYRSTTNDTIGEIHSLFSKSDILPLLPISSTLLTVRNYPGVNTKVGKNQFVFSLLASYAEPEPRDQSSLIVKYDQSTDNFDILWESFGQHSQYLSPDRTKIYVATDYYNPWQTYDGNWQIIDLLSGETSITNWLPLNQTQYSDLSYDTEWRVDFAPITQESNQITIASAQPGSQQMILTHKNGFQKIIKYPEGISDCSGGWIFK